MGSLCGGALLDAVVMGNECKLQLDSFSRELRAVAPSKVAG